MVHLNHKDTYHRVNLLQFFGGKIAVRQNFQKGYLMFLFWWNLGLILFLLYISDVRDDVVYNVAIYIDDTILSTLIVSRHQPIRPCMVYCCQVWASARSCHLKMLDKLQKRIYMTVDPSFAASFEPLGHCQYVACLSLL